MKWIIAVAFLISVLCSVGCSDQSESPANVNDDESVQIRIDDGKWISMEGTVQKMGDREYSLHAYCGRDGFTAISWKGAEPVGEFRWSFISQGPIEGNLFQSKLESNTDYFSFYIEAKEAMDSPGAITITEFGNAGEFVVGRFTIEKASQVHDGSGKKIGSARIEGKFRIRRSA